MSAILAILIMLAGALAVAPLARGAGTPPGTMALLSPNIPWPTVAPTYVSPNFYQPSPIGLPVNYNLNLLVGSAPKGTLFWVYIDGYNVTFLKTWQVGFTYNKSVVQVVNNALWTNVTYGSILSLLSPSKQIQVAGSIDTANDTVAAFGDSATDGNYYNGTGAQHAVNFMSVEFEIVANTTYQEAIAGTPVSLMSFSWTNTQTQLIFEDGQSPQVEIPNVAVNNATITFTLPPPHAPVASSKVTPGTTALGGAQTFDASGSSQGWTGTASVSIKEYQWTWMKVGTMTPNGTISYETTPTITNTFPAIGTYYVNLTVWAWTPNNSYNMSSAPETQVAVVIAKAVGCGITLYTQPWRYIDPYYIPTTFVGMTLPGPTQNGTEADSFRPGDLVQLFANVTYNGAPVSNALVTFQVIDAQGNTEVFATAVSNCYGQAEWDFRIPWPSTANVIENNFTGNVVSTAPSENTTLFGQWTAYATWQLGNPSEKQPYETTQTAYIKFDVSWGLTIVEIVEPTPATSVYRGPNSCGYGQSITVKVNVYNEYLEPVNGTLIATAYDNLLVPIYPSLSVAEPNIPVGTTSYNLGTIAIPSYAYVGTGYLVVNLLSTWPQFEGTAFCPTNYTTFQITAYP